MSILPTYRAGRICIPWWYGLGYPLVYLALGVAIGISKSDTMAIALSQEAIIALLVCALAGAIVYNVLYSLSKFREQQLDAAQVYENIVASGRDPSEPSQLTAQEKWDLQKVQRFDPIFMVGIIIGVILATACAVAISWFYLYRWVGTEWYEWAALGFIISLIAAWFINESVVKLATSGLWAKVSARAFQGVVTSVAENPEAVTLLDEYVEKFIAGGFSKKDAIKKAQEYLANHPELIK